MEQRLLLAFIQDLRLKGKIVKHPDITVFESKLFLKFGADIERILQPVFEAIIKSNFNDIILIDNPKEPAVTVTARNKLLINFLNFPSFGTSEFSKAIEKIEGPKKENKEEVLSIPFSKEPRIPAQSLILELSPDLQISVLLVEGLKWYKAPKDLVLERGNELLIIWQRRVDEIINVYIGNQGYQIKNNSLVASWGSNREFPLEEDKRGKIIINLDLIIGNYYLDRLLKAA